MAMLGVNSHTPALLHAGAVFGAIFIGFGINATVKPNSLLDLCEFTPPKAKKDVKLVHSIVVIYGIRDIYMGLSMFAAWYYGHRSIMGLLLISGAAVAIGDGFVNRAQIGRGEWKHWNYPPFMILVGAALLGALDGV